MIMIIRNRQTKSLQTCSQLDRVQAALIFCFCNLSSRMFLLMLSSILYIAICNHFLVNTIVYCFFE